jgi:hypothetical protein
LNGQTLLLAARSSLLLAACRLLPLHVGKRLKRNNEKIPDAETRHTAAEEQILCLVKLQIEPDILPSSA